jgi:hypothetical protein
VSRGQGTKEAFALIRFLDQFHNLNIKFRNLQTEEKTTHLFVVEIVLERIFCERAQRENGTTVPFGFGRLRRVICAWWHQQFHQRFLDFTQAIEINEDTTFHSLASFSTEGRCELFLSKHFHVPHVFLGSQRTINVQTV